MSKSIHFSWKTNRGLNSVLTLVWRWHNCWGWMMWPTWEQRMSNTCNTHILVVVHVGRSILCSSTCLRMTALLVYSYTSYYFSLCAHYWTTGFCSTPTGPTVTIFDILTQWKYANITPKQIKKVTTEQHTWLSNSKASYLHQIKIDIGPNKVIFDQIVQIKTVIWANCTLFIDDADVLDQSGLYRIPNLVGNEPVNLT